MLNCNTLNFQNFQIFCIIDVDDCTLIPVQLNRGQLGLESIGRDLNVEPVWMQGITGLNVTVAVVDDGKLK